MTVERDRARVHCVKPSEPSMPRNTDHEQTASARSETALSERPAIGEYVVPQLEDAEGGASAFRVYWHVLKRRWPTVITVASAVTLLATLISLKMQPVYKATARLEVKGEMPQLQTINEIDRHAPVDSTFLQTQVDLLQNDSLMWQTIHRLDLESRPEFNPRRTASSKSQLESLPPLQDRLIRAFKKHLHVALMGNSRLITVSFESTDPELAANAANTLATNFVEANFQGAYDTTREATKWMEQQLDELKTKVERSQQALVDYEKANDIASIGDKENVVQLRLEDLSKDLTTAQTDRAQKESLWESVQEDNSLAEVASNDALLQHLEQNYADLKTQYAESLAQAGPNFYKAVQIRKQLAEVESLINRQRMRLVKQTKDAYDTAVRRETLLSRTVAEQRKDVERLNQLLIQHNILKGEFETNQQLYNDLLRRLKDATLSVSLRAASVRVADRARVPAVPVRPDTRRNFPLFAFAGLVIGVTLAFAQEALNNSIRTPDDLEGSFSIRALTIVPAVFSSRLPYSRLPRLRSKHPLPPSRIELAVLENSSLDVAEAFRILRTSILLSMTPRPPQLLLITSPLPCEGKTSCSINLAASLAQRGGRVLLLDADLRRPGVARALSLDGKKGLSTVLTGGHQIEVALETFQNLSTLSILCAGPVPPNPSELVSSATMEQVIGELRRRFDHIVIDSPPALVFTDATILSALVDAVVLVVESDVTTRAALRRARQTIEQAGAHIVGAILNKATRRATDGYYGSRYSYYGSYYHKPPTSDVLDSGNGSSG